MDEWGVIGIVGGSVVLTIVLIVVIALAIIALTIGSIVAIWTIVIKVMRKHKAERQELMDTGVAGDARVVTIQQTGMMVNHNPQVELTLEVAPKPDLSFPAGQGKFVVTTRTVVPMVSISALQPGSVVPVKFDPTNPNQLGIDFAAMGFGDGSISPWLARRVI